MKDFIVYAIIGIGLLACASEKVSRQLTQVQTATAQAVIQ